PSGGRDYKETFVGRDRKSRRRRKNEQGDPKNAEPKSIRTCTLPRESVPNTFHTHIQYQSLNPRGTFR
ncbi:unnamed protein product, partial [Scytosiphon promiscuus]